jgi:hypothetical protein
MVVLAILGLGISLLIACGPIGGDDSTESGSDNITGYGGSSGYSSSGYSSSGYSSSGYSSSGYSSSGYSSSGYGGSSGYGYWQ